MDIFLFVAHAALALLIIVLVLLQQGKGAEAGISFGAGASQTLLGSQGGSSFFAKLTAMTIALFFATSLGLTIVAKHQASVDYQDQTLAPLLESQDESVQEPQLLPELPSVGIEGADTEPAKADGVKADVVIESESDQSTDSE